MWKKSCEEIIKKEIQSINIETLKNKISRLLEKKKTINKSKGRANHEKKLKTFENEEFLLPIPTPPVRKKRKVETSQFMVESLTIAKETTINQLTATELDNKKLKTNLDKCITGNQSLKKQVNVLQQMWLNWKVKTQQKMCILWK